MELSQHGNILAIIVKFANGTIIMLNIPKIFQAKSTLQSDRRDVIDDVIVPSLL
jgi:hypothetical protein